MRELFWAARAKRRDEWDHTCSLIATMCNTAFGKKRRPVDPLKIHPLRKKVRKRRRQLTNEETTRLLDEMVGL